MGSMAKVLPMALGIVIAGHGWTGDSPLCPDPTDFAALPLLRLDTRVHYVGSIDKKGGNADWDWGLYQDERGEWVLAEVEGPGCLWNFVVHHDVARSDPTYRFYFDGESAPRLAVRHSAIGSQAPLLPPWGDWYGPKLKGGQDARVLSMDFRIVRSFLPMPFRRGLRITSSVKLEGNAAPQQGAGGWGHAIYHSYPTAGQLQTFTAAALDQSLAARNAATVQGPPAGPANQLQRGTLAPGAALRLFEARGEGLVAAVSLRLPKWSPEALTGLWIRCWWDDESQPAVDLPFGTFFGNERGDHPLATMLTAFDPAGWSRQRFPMPFWKSARIELVNRAATARSFEVESEVSYRLGACYDPAAAGHFRATPWRRPLPGAPGEDALIAEFAGYGHVVAGVVARLGGCEGDIRVHIDGAGTPSIQSDGSESWVCYGWGYYSAPEANPFSAYDGPNSDASMIRLLPGDAYPFRQGLRCSAEPGGGRRTPQSGTLRSGALFWYGEPGRAATITDVLRLGDAASEAAHGYRADGGQLLAMNSRFEGAQDHLPLAGNYRRGFARSSFFVAIDPANRGVILRRRSSQAEGRHRALVSIDGVPVAERAWIWPDCNPHQAWLEDEFQIPAALTAGKGRLHVEIVPQAVAGRTAWNEARYTVYSLGVGLAAAAVEARFPGEELPPLPHGEAGR